MSKTPEEIALERIRQAADSGAESLNLSNLELTSLPSEIGQLIKLTTLYLHINQLTSLSPEIGQLTNLTSLMLSGNGLTSLPPKISQLTSLKKLDLASNELTNLPSEIGQLTSLTELNLSLNQLTTLPSEIGHLTNLTQLYLWGNELTGLPPEISQLNNLKELEINLNQLTSLPPKISQLTNLTSLSLSGNKLTSLPPEIAQFTKLIELYISHNQLKNLLPEIGQLSNLTKIDLSSNQLTSLPKEAIALHNLENIYLLDNPLEIAIPAKWVGKKHRRNSHAQEILAYYKRIYEEGGRELGEARVLVVGEGGVGKTSIVKRLIDNTFNDQEDTTLIVEKRPLPLGDVRAQVWDFGGQEHMHATHQFFFSGRSLYLLVFDTRGSLEQNKVEYWLTLINAYSKNAPVILVGNKCDQHEMDLEKRRLREKYPNIRGFVGTSASTGKHIEELRQKIQEEVRAMPQVRVLFSADYLAVKDEMENLDKPHISHEQFIEICERHGVSDAKDQDTLLDLLHDLGTVLYFRDADGNPLLPALGVLNPNWVTGGVYRIVTHAALKDKFKGKLTMNLLREILSAPEYSRHCEDIAKLLERFELCYRADDSVYWLPSLMEKDEPAAIGDFTTTMKFEYWYPELPKSVIVRFIVKAHKMILDSQVWRYGVVLKLDGNIALARADERDKRISILITGEESTRRDALAILRSHFDDIHAMFATPPEAFIYPPQYPDLPLPFADMKTLAKTEREHKAVYQGKPVTINLRELLDGFVTPQERRKDEEREREEFKRRGGDTYVTNINVSGNVSGNIVAGNENQIRQSISNADLAPELKDTLLQLANAVQTMLPALSTDAAKKAEKNLKKLVEEASEPEPDRQWYEVSIEGLIQAAKNLNELGTPVISLAGKVLKLLSGLS